MTLVYFADVASFLRSPHSRSVTVSKAAGPKPRYEYTLKPNDVLEPQTAGQKGWTFVLFLGLATCFVATVLVLVAPVVR